MSILATVRDRLCRMLCRNSGGRVLTLADVLYQEGRQIHGEDFKLTAADPNEPPPLHDIYLELNRRETAALCLSGGGIRSASFALGLLQCFASDPKGSAAGAPTPPNERLLTKFKYLSTVSGGGYIGSWLSAWLMRAGEAGATTRVIEDLGRAQADTEPPQITNLRSDSSYLTPKVGALSADLWADLTMIVRNLVLNWAVFLPALAAVVLLAKVYAAIEFALLQPSDDGFSCWLWAALLGSLAAFMVSLSYQSANRPSQGRSNRTQWWFLVCDLLPAVIAAALASLVIGSQVGASLADFARLGTDDGWWPVDILLALIGAGLYIAGWLLSRVLWHRRRNLARGIGEVTPLNWRAPGVRKRVIFEFLWGIAAGALFGFLVALAADQLTGYPEQRALLVLILGAPVILLAQLIAQIFFVGAISLRQPDDDDREWLARAGGWYVAAIVAWVALMALVILGSNIAEKLWTTAGAWLSSVGGISGAITLILGKSSFTSPDPTHRKRGIKALSLDTILAIATPIFAAALVVAASALLDKFLFDKSFTKTALFGGPPVASAHWFDCPPVVLVVALAVAIVLVAIVPWRININRFSLHALYRNRLIRAFLAASRTSPRGGEIDRPKRNLFTDMDPCDNLPMWTLWDRYSSQRGERWQPFHVINMALNIVSSKNLAWQERKAEPFTVSALHSGSGCRAFDGPGAFQPTENYGGKPGFGLSLGTAMAISGAAASPNMGYNSSPAVTFLMALFNVRLGWWLPNPGKKGSGYHATVGPRWALGAFVAELFGLTQDDRRYVYLSDGGHFENLGLYEMVRRRCRYIVVSDAGCDPDFNFADLGNAIRKIQIDLGVRIEMKGLEHLKKRGPERQRPDAEQRYYATAVIHYHEVDGGDAKDGHLLYIKAGLRWSESPDILSYALSHPTFPHETTADQWFTESQFESYRHLGFTVGSAILKDAGIDRECAWQDVFEGLSR